MTSGIEISTWIEQKWARGISHLRAIEDLIGGYSAAGNVWLEHALSEDQYSVDSTLRVKAMPPLEQMSLCLGDAIHNFRSALDCLAWELCHLGGNSPKRPRQVSFPCVSEESKWKEQEKNLSSMPTAFLERIKKVQPFSQTEGFGPMQLLSELSNQDKHREMISGLASISSFSLDVYTGGETAARNGITDGIRAELLHPEMTLIDFQPFAHFETSVPISLNKSRDYLELSYQIILDDKIFVFEDVKIGLFQLGDILRFVKEGSNYLPAQSG